MACAQSAGLGVEVEPDNPGGVGAVAHVGARAIRRVGRIGRGHADGDVLEARQRAVGHPLVDADLELLEIVLQQRGRPLQHILSWS